MVKTKLKYLYYDIYKVLTFEPKKILTISKESGVSWEATKNCLEVLSYIGYIEKVTPNIESLYKKKQFIDIDITFRELLLRDLKEISKDGRNKFKRKNIRS